MSAIRRIVLLQAAVVALLIALSPFVSRAAEGATTQPSANDVSGTWKWTMQGRGGGGDIDVVLKLKQQGDKLTGTITGFGGDEQDIQDGKVDDGKISFKVVRDFNGNQITTNYTATVENGTIKGKTETIFSRGFEGKREQ
jgi:hypothetical protein